MQHGERQTILVVDDIEDNVEILRAHLDSRGYNVEVARDGQAALDAVYQSPPNLILLDVMMPVMTGIEVLQRLKADKSLPFIPVILQTALDSTDDLINGLNAGADDYISKPINLPELEARVRSLLRLQLVQLRLEERERELSHLNEQLLIASQIDGLTQVSNRRHLDERFSEVWEQAERYNEPVSLVMCDIDHFKHCNDTYGHQVGDKVLRQFADLLKSAARGVDKIGRYGGEEFLIVLPGTVLDAAVSFAERVREMIEAEEFSTPRGKIKKTASFGVAAWPHPLINNREELVKASDEALYVAKEQGRNRVIRFDGKEFNEHTSKKDAGSSTTAIDATRQHPPVQ